MEVTTKTGPRKYRPHNQRMLVSQDEAEKEKKVGDKVIHIPDTAQVKPGSGKVMEIASDITDIKIGDIVLFGPGSGLEVELEGKKYLLLHAVEVIMIGEEGDDITSK